jgi:hypothetical protein
MLTKGFLGLTVAALLTGMTWYGSLLPGRSDCRAGSQPCCTSPQECCCPCCPACPACCLTEDCCAACPAPGCCDPACVTACAGQ